MEYSNKSKQQNSNADLIDIGNISKRKFLGEITIYEIILCVFVILIHLYSEVITTCENQLVLNTFFFLNKIIYFTVPGFIFSSGIKLFYNSDLKPVKYFEFIAHRIKKIYFPYVFWVCAYYLFFVYYTRYLSFNIFDLIRYIAVGDLVAHFYFILVIMQFYLFFPFIKIYVKHMNPILGIIVAGFITIFSMLVFKNITYMDRIMFRYFVYFILGCYVGKNYDSTLKKLSRFKYIIYLLASIFCFIYLSCFFNGLQVMISYEYICILEIFFCVFMFLAMFTLLASSKRVLEISKKPTVKVLGVATFYVYLMHCMFIFIAEKKLTEFGVVATVARFAIKLIFVTGISFLLSILYVKLKNSAKKILKRQL